MKIRKLAIVTIVGFGAATYGSARGAEFMTGNALLHICEDTSPSGSGPGICLGYVSGASDQLDSLKDTILPNLNYCLDQKVTTAQIRNLVVKYLRSHPKRLDQAASYLVYDALTEAYPCTSG